MACILCIETATEVCSVAVAIDDEVLFQRVEYQGPSHASLLGVFVDEAMKELRSRNIDLDAVAVSSGPGSYTGLRIGVSQAKGLCYGLGIPLMSIPTLTIMANSVSKTANKDALLCPMIDARRMEVYDAIFDTGMNQMQEVRADIIDEESFSDLLRDTKVLFFGNGSQKCKDALKHPNALFVDSVYPLATDMVEIAYVSYLKSDFVDVAYFEPFYLKEFIATVPKNKVL